MDEMAFSASYLNIHLIGKQGSGMSATGNSILKSKAFRSKISSKCVTTEVQHGEGTIGDRRVRVWDRPGVTEDKKQMADIVGNLRKVVEEKKREGNILLWVIRYGDLCGPDDQSLLTTLSNAFGQEFVAVSTAVVVTHKDNFDSDVEPEKSLLTFEDWKNQQVGFFSDLCHLCANRVMPIDNKLKDEAQRGQLATLLDSTFRATRTLPQLSPQGGDQQSQGGLGSTQNKIQQPCSVPLKTLITQLSDELPMGDLERRLASLDKIRVDLDGCDTRDQRAVVLFFRYQVEREIEKCRVALAEDQQTKHFLNKLVQLL